MPFVLLQIQYSFLQKVKNNNRANFSSFFFSIGQENKYKSKIIKNNFRKFALIEQENRY